MTKTVDMERLAAVWRKMQDKREQLAHDYKLADLEIENQQDQISNVLLVAMTGMKADKLQTAAGTIERQMEYKPSGKDWAAFYRFIVEHNRFDMLHKRISSTAVKEYAEAHTVKDEDGNDVPTLPPGISVYTGYKLTVKKPATKKLPTTEGSANG